MLRTSGGLTLSLARSFYSPSDVMTVLRQLQTFLLVQHSRDEAALQDYILRALLGVCQVRVLSWNSCNRPM